MRFHGNQMIISSFFSNSTYVFSLVWLFLFFGLNFMEIALCTLILYELYAAGWIREKVQIE